MRTAVLPLALLLVPGLAARDKYQAILAALDDPWVDPEGRSDGGGASLAEAAREAEDEDRDDAAEIAWVPDARLPDLGGDFSSVLEEGSGGSQNRSKRGWGEEDVECFCIDYYEYVDWDDYSHYSDPEDCMQGHDRCNEKCERESKHIVRFEGMRQTLSFCGTDEGWLSQRPECQCLDGSDTFKHSNKKKAQKKYGNPNILTQFAGGAAHAYEGYGSNAANLRACYQNCPSLCASKKKLTGGCAMPTSA